MLSRGIGQYLCSDILRNVDSIACDHHDLNAQLIQRSDDGLREDEIRKLAIYSRGIVTFESSRGGSVNEISPTKANCGAGGLIVSTTAPSGVSFCFGGVTPPAFPFSLITASVLSPTELHLSV